MGAGGARFSAGQGGPGGGGFEDIFSSMFGGGAHPGARSAPGGAGANPDIEDLLKMFGGQGGGFGGGGPAGFSPNRAPAKGSDTSARTRISFRDAALGTELKLSVDRRTVHTRTPAGVHGGPQNSLRGKGRPVPGGAPAGDLLLTLDVEEHPVWSADGANLRITVPVGFDEAVLGTTVSVPLLDGGTVSV